MSAHTDAELIEERVSYWQEVYRREGKDLPAEHVCSFCPEVLPMVSYRLELMRENLALLKALEQTGRKHLIMIVFKAKLERLNRGTA